MKGGDPFEQIRPLPPAVRALRDVAWLGSECGRHPIARRIHDTECPLGGEHRVETLQVEHGARIPETDSPLAAFILVGHGPTVLQRLADHLALTLQAAFGAVRCIDVRAVGTTPKDAAAVILIDADASTQAAFKIRAALTHDLAIERILVVGANRELRRKYDAAVAKSFAASRIRSVLMLLTRKQRVWRFSEFTVVERSFFAGQSFTIRFPFGELAHHEIALQQAAKAIRSGGGRDRGIVVATGTHRSRDEACDDTDLMFSDPVLRVNAPWGAGVRRTISRALATLAHLREMPVCNRRAAPRAVWHDTAPSAEQSKAIDDHPLVAS